MILAKDFEDFIRLLNKHEVEYMVVGGYALAFHGKPRNTGDMDIWIDNSDKNAEKMMQVAGDFGLKSLGLTKEDFTKEGFITQIGYPPLRIDILNSIDGVGFKQAYENRRVVDMEGLKAPFIGKEDFIKNKRATGRAQDLTDIKSIERGKGRRR
jgi:predicted nucleotidyltransferase